MTSDQTVTEALAGRFAMPGDQGTAPLLDAVARQRLGQLRRRLVDAAGVSELSRFEPGPRSAWTAELGFALNASAAADWERAAMQWTAAVAISGAHGILSLHLSTPVPFYLQGRLFTVAGQVTIRSAPECVEVTCEEGRSRFDRSTGAWEQDSTHRSRWISHRIEGAESASVSITNWSMTASGAFPWSQLDTRLAPSGGALPAVLVDALAILTSAAPQQARWVNDALPAVLVVEPGLTSALACSDARSVGMTALSPPAGALHCAELLVHQASRQHLLALSGVVALSESDAPEAWYCSISRLYASTLKLLGDAHSYANIARLYATLDAANVLDRPSRLRAMRARLLRDECLENLSRSRSLTTSGNALLRTLVAG